MTKTVCKELPDFQSRMKAAEFIAGQIAAEKTISAERLKWNLTFQGFALATFGLVFRSSLSDLPSLRWLLWIIVVAASIISIATLAGLEASGAQRKSLKKFWKENIASVIDLHEPFSPSGRSFDGKFLERTICVVISTMWILLGVLISLHSYSAPPA